MNYRNLFRIAFRAIANNKMRAFLTMLGVIIGVAAVIAMLAIGQGSKRSIRASIEEMGSNMIMIHPGGERMGGVRLSSSDMQSLKLEDYQAIVNQNTYLDKITPTVNSSGQLIYGGNNTPSTVYGVNEQYLDIRRYAIGSGEMFTESDIKRAAKVCVVGQTVVDNLFTKGEDPLGKTIRFNSIPFRIIGVLESKGYNSMGQDQDDLILAPYTTVQKRILAITYIQGITASAIDESQTQQAIDEISDILRTNHKLRATDEDDFTVRSTQEMSEMMTSTMDMMTILLACIASISLVVGGIGIMNIMYVSVTERTKEIGLRMSVGARGIDVLTQFLIEAVLISFTGGVIGVLIGCSACMAIKYLADWPVNIQTWSIVLSFVVCTVTGVFFGWYPARKASNLDPIDALRYE